jgi:hypothetical protein
VHDPGKIVADLAVALALGGGAWPMSRCCGQPELAGAVAWDPVVSRLVSTRADALRTPHLASDPARHNLGAYRGNGGVTRADTLNAKHRAAALIERLPKLVGGFSTSSPIEEYSR